MSPSRTPEQIRASLEENRKELTNSIELLRSDVNELSDWRGHVRRNQRVAVIGVAVAGFVLAGGLGGITGLLRRG